MTVLLVRHARAGRRQAWDGDDRLRPLSGRGTQQAKSMASVLADLVGKPKRPIAVVSSPWVRCVETVTPLAEVLGVEITQDLALGEGHSVDALELLGRLSGQTAVLCTHGDVVESALAWLARSGVDLGRHPSYPKGSTWVLHSRRGHFHVARYVPPPS